MTISTTSIKAVATGNGATTVWPFGFLIPNQASLVVTLIDVASGNPTVVSPVNYSVSGLNNPAGGSVTYPLSGSPLTSATQIVIQRQVSNTQGTTFANQSATYPADIEAALDYVTMIAQQNADAISRSIVFSIGDTVPVQLPPAASRGNKYIAFDSFGNPIASPGPLAGVAVSAAMTPVVQAATTAQALTLLGIPGSLLDQLIPAGTVWDYTLPTAPGGFVFATGQPCTSLYPTYRAALVSAGSPFGTNGVDPLMPDLRSAVIGGKSNMGGVDNGLLTGGTVLGALLGVQNSNLAANQIPPLTSTNASQGITVSGVSNETNIIRSSAGFLTVSTPGSGAYGFSTNPPTVSGISMSSSGNNAITVNYTNGALQPYSRIQPTFILNKIVKVH